MIHQLLSLLCDKKTKKKEEKKPLIEEKKSYCDETKKPRIRTQKQIGGNTAFNKVIKIL